MPAVLTQELFQESIERALLDVMPQVAGCTLLEGGSPPEGDVYTVHTVFVGDTRADLSLCAQAGVFTRITQRITRQEQVSLQDLEDAAKEMFNVLCGHVAVDLSRTANLTFRFQIPQFSRGRRIPEGHTWLFALNYRDDHNEGIQLIHHVQAHAEPSDQAC